ncbi:hypothetical protein ACFWUQ_02510 [Streptomyces sp. NPDC058662]|uniref:hypothetical protein n=1 Tax=Streptomyces sp. NPDC058662 TaxID=3346583 RepID=UPI003658C1AB
MSAGAPDARRARLVLVAAALAAAVLCVGLGFAGATLFDDADSDNRPPVVVPTAAGAPGSAPTPVPDGEPMTPEKAKKITLPPPTGQKDGVSTGFGHSHSGAIAAAVYFWEEYAFLDDEEARQQLTAVTSPEAVGYIDDEVSEIRKAREYLGLPPSGGLPAGITFTASVRAVRPTSILVPGLPAGDVLQVWLSYDRFATGLDGLPDKDPLRGETIDFVLKWQDGAWRFTNEFDAMRTFPVSYEPDSPFAWSDGWVQVRHGD